MEITLALAQTTFYFTFSAAAIVLGTLCAIVVYHLIHITRELEELSRNLHQASNEVGEQIRDIIDRLAALPILSYFLTKRPIRHPTSGSVKTARKG